MEGSEAGRAAGEAVAAGWGAEAEVAGLEEAGLEETGLEAEGRAAVGSAAAGPGAVGLAAEAAVARDWEAQGLAAEAAAAVGSEEVDWAAGREGPGLAAGEQAEAGRVARVKGAGAAEAKGSVAAEAAGAGLADCCTGLASSIYSLETRLPLREKKRGERNVRRLLG